MRFIIIIICQLLTCWMDIGRPSTCISSTPYTYTRIRSTIRVDVTNNIMSSTMYCTLTHSARNNASSASKYILPECVCPCVCQCRPCMLNFVITFYKHNQTVLTFCVVRRNKPCSGWSLHTERSFLHSNNKQNNQVFFLATPVTTFL